MQLGNSSTCRIAVGLAGVVFSMSAAAGFPKDETQHGEDAHSAGAELSIDRASLYACGDLAIVLAGSIEEAIETTEACVLSHGDMADRLRDSADQPKVSPLLSPLAHQMYVYTYALLARYAPAALPALQQRISRYRGPIWGDTLKQLAKDLVSLLRKNKFKCPSDSNPLSCRR